MKAAEFQGQQHPVLQRGCSAGVLVLKLDSISLVFKKNLDWKCYCSASRFCLLDEWPHKIFKQEKVRYVHPVKETITSVTADLITLSHVVRLSASFDLSTVFSHSHCTLLMLLGLSFVCVAARHGALLFEGWF